jgi:hypothetical protein
MVVRDKAKVPLLLSNLEAIASMAAETALRSPPSPDRVTAHSTCCHYACCDVQLTVMVVFELNLTPASIRDPVEVVDLGRDLNFVELIASATVRLQSSNSD